MYMSRIWKCAWCMDTIFAVTLCTWVEFEPMHGWYNLLRSVVNKHTLLGFKTWHGWITICCITNLYVQLSVSCHGSEKNHLVPARRICVNTDSSCWNHHNSNREFLYTGNGNFLYLAFHLFPITETQDEPLYNNYHFLEGLSKLTYDLLMSKTWILQTLFFFFQEQLE